MQRLTEAKKFLSEKCPEFPKILVVLGSGLSGLLDEMEVRVNLPFHDIPHCGSSTVEGHPGRLVIGLLNNKNIACMQGRLHYYEGYTMEQVVFPFRVFAQLGVQRFILTNAAGGLHSGLSPKDLVLVTDHINLMGNNPLIGKNEEALGPRFPDLTYLYDRELQQTFLEAAKRCDLTLKKGVYVGIHGPSYETPSEIKMYRMLGGDVVGMSTVPEAICLGHMKKRVVALSCVTNLAAGVGDGPLVHSDVVDNAKKAYKNFSKLVLEAIGMMDG